MISGTVNGIDDLSGYTCHFVAKKKLSSTEKAINASSTSRDVLTCDLTEESLDCDLAEEVLTCDFIE